MTTNPSKPAFLLRFSFRMAPSQRGAEFFGPFEAFFLKSKDAFGGNAEVTTSEVGPFGNFYLKRYGNVSEISPISWASDNREGPVKILKQ